MFPQQIRYDRYRIIYMWKILEGKVQNCGIQENANEDKERLVKVPKLKSKARNLKESSVPVYSLVS